MTKRKYIIWSVVAAIIIFLIVYASFIRKPEVQYLTTEVKKENLKETISVTGTLKSNDTIALNFETTGRIKDIRVKVGQKVAKGDILALADDSNLQLAVDQAKANLNKAQADAGANYDSIHAAKVSADNAENYLDDTKKLNSKNINAAEQSIEDAKDYLDDAQSYYDQIKADNGASSATTKLAKLTLDTAQTNYNKAKDALEVAKKQADLSETSANNSVEAAKANLDSARSKYVTASRDATVAGFEAAYEAALNNLDKAVLCSPAAGVIKSVNYEIGEVLGANIEDSFAKMISYDYILEAKVPESDIAKIKIGQKASLTFDAFDANEAFSAVIASVDPSATVVQDVVDYVVKLSMDKDDPRFKDGMSADIDINIVEKNNVFLISERSIKEENGKKTVQILEEGEAASREITTGLSGDGGMIEVTSGLKEGEMVITSIK